MLNDLYTFSVPVFCGVTPFSRLLRKGRGARGSYKSRRQSC